MELWDLYNEKREPLHQDHVRGQALPPGAYHLVVHILVCHLIDNHTYGTCIVCYRVYKYECTCSLVV